MNAAKTFKIVFHVGPLAHVTERLSQSNEHCKTIPEATEQIDCADLQVRLSNRRKTVFGHDPNAQYI